jgi:DNA repair protein RecO (recombination protein O)
MSMLVTEAIVLHSFDYLETSRIIRLLTRDAGVQSVIARGARNSRKRFGGAVDLFAQGTAEIDVRPNRELHTLVSLDVTRARPQFATDVGRFIAGSMIAELVLQSSSDEPSPSLFDSIERAFNELVDARPEATIATALSGAWHIVATLGFTPALDVCANCHANLDPEARVGFSHSAGGALCARCGALAAGSRVIPPSARGALREWTSGGSATAIDASEERAHQRLLREFVQEHLGGEKELRAYRVWEQGEWTAA